MTMKIKKGVGILDFILIVVIGVLAFSVMFNWIVVNSNEAELNIDARYNDSFINLTENQLAMDTTTKQLRGSLNNITEAKGVVSTAFFGLRGMLAIFLLPLQIFDPVLETLSLAVDLLDFVPNGVKVAATIGLTVMLTFAFLRFFTQRSNDA